MLTSIWYVESPEFDVATFAEKYDFDASDTWNKGDADVDGNVLETSGFSICIADADDIAKHLDEIREFLSEGEQPISEIADRGFTSRLDVGFSPGQAERASKSLHFPNDILATLIDRKIELAVTAYREPPLEGEDS